MRPIPRNRISVREATLFSSALFLASNVMLHAGVNEGSFIIANTIFFTYIFGYTPLKRKTELNTLLGSIVGALPPVLGWVAAGGSAFAVEPISMFLFIFCWQFPHFYGILWTYRQDYDRMNYKMESDHIRASKIMIASLFGKLASVIALTASGGFSYSGAAAMIFLLYKYTLTSIKNFRSNPSTENAKKLKKSVYLPFGLFFLVILLQIFKLTPEELIKWLLSEKKQEADHKKDMIDIQADPVATSVSVLTAQDGAK